MSDEEFAERVTAMTQTLYRVCYAQLSQACDREDAVQEALRKCWQKRGQLRDARYLQTWVIRVLLNECHNIQRRAARLQPCATLPERAAAPQPMGTTRVGEALLGSRKSCACPWFCTTWRDIPWRTSPRCCASRRAPSRPACAGGARRSRPC